MSRTIGLSLLGSLASPTMAPAFLWTITRRDGVVFRFTTWTTDLTVDGHLYAALGGMTPGAAEIRLNDGGASMEVSGLYAATGITEAALRGGLFDGATVTVAVTDAATLATPLVLWGKTWGDTTLRPLGFTVTLLGAARILERPAGDLYSATCRARFGDTACGISVAAHQAAGAVATVTTPRHITATGLTAATGAYDHGVLTWTSGLNTGSTHLVKTYTNSGGVKTLYFARPVGMTIAVGDAFTVTEGCDKRLSTCQATFDNALRFRGEPFMPGLDGLAEPATGRHLASDRSYQVHH